MTKLVLHCLICKSTGVVETTCFYMNQQASFTFSFSEMVLIAWYLVLSRVSQLFYKFGLYAIPESWCPHALFIPKAPLMYVGDQCPLEAQKSTNILIILCRKPVPLGNGFLSLPSWQLWLHCLLWKVNLVSLKNTSCCCGQKSSIFVLSNHKAFLQRVFSLSIWQAANICKCWLKMSYLEKWVFIGWHPLSPCWC